MSDAPEMTAARLSRAKQVGERRIKLAGSFRIAGDATAGAEPDGHAIAPTSKPQPGGTLVKALARAWRWQNMLDAGFYTSVSEIGETENISKSCVSRILRLALLAPEIVEAILAGKTDAGLMLESLERPLPVRWEEQRRQLLATRPAC